MKKLFISAGHTNIPGQDRGAFGNGYYEGDLTVELRDLIVAELKALCIIVNVDSNKNALLATLNYLKTLFFSKEDIIIDIHFNAASPGATGVEVLVPDNPSVLEKQIATALCEIHARVLMIKNRGVKTESQSAYWRLIV